MHESQQSLKLLSAVRDDRLYFISAAEETKEPPSQQAYSRNNVHLAAVAGVRDWQFGIDEPREPLFRGKKPIRHKSADDKAKRAASVGRALAKQDVVTRNLNNFGVNKPLLLTKSSKTHSLNESSKKNSSNEQQLQNSVPNVTFFDLSNPQHLNQLFGKLN